MVLFPGILLSCLFIAALADDFSKCPSALPRNQYLKTFRNRCYEFVVYREAYWPDANAQCRSSGGYLVSVNDAETQQFLVSSLVRLNFAKHGIWIGLNDQKIESTYEWISGDNVTYTHWATGEPNFAHGVEDCVLMKSTKAYAWEDHPCHLWPQHYAFICEYEMFQSTALPPSAPGAAYSVSSGQSGYPTQYAMVTI